MLANTLFMSVHPVLAARPCSVSSEVPSGPLGDGCLLWGTGDAVTGDPDMQLGHIHTACSCRIAS